MLKSLYRWSVIDDVIVIYDVGHSLGLKTVTNDAENVLKEIKERMGEEEFRSAPAAIYRDSDDMYDGLKLDRHGDAIFYPLRTTDLKEAIEKALNLKRGTCDKKDSKEGDV